uniref:Uncharacterized protein n=1 Tax=Lepeophtheirus salmonis TaxID=72036 RepID=A0A0K2V294_LEPSM
MNGYASIYLSRS